jgi:ABC-2 type transport system permease protein
MRAGAGAATDDLHEIRGPRVFGTSLRRFWTLVWLSSVAEFKLMYVGSAFGSILGYAWALARPLLTFAIIYIVFSQILRVGSTVPFYAAMLMFNLHLYFFLADTSNRAVQAFVSREGVLRKMDFPHAVIPFSIVLTGIFTFALNLIVVFGIVIAVGTPPRSTWLLLPLLWLLMLVFCTAIAVLLSTLFVRFRDIAQIWAVGLLLLFYFSPVMYPVELVPDGYQWVLVLNPIAPIFEQMRVWAVDPAGETATQIAGGLGLVGPAILFLAVCVSATILMARRTPTMAEDL